MKKLVIFISSAIFILVLVIIFGFRIKLTNKDIELELNSSYEEPGYGYYFYGKKLNKKFDIKGDVDTSKVGEYEITYTTKFLLKHTKKRIVRIKEYEKPVITLEGNGYVCPTKEYIEEGYKAIDNYDGDITDKVIVIKNANEIIYEVTDTSGNKTQIKRPIIYDDIENPSIKLIDGNIKLKKNEEYKEPGY